MDNSFSFLILDSFRNLEISEIIQIIFNCKYGFFIMPNLKCECCVLFSEEIKTCALHYKPVAAFIRYCSWCCIVFVPNILSEMMCQQFKLGFIRPQGFRRRFHRAIFQR